MCGRTRKLAEPPLTPTWAISSESGVPQLGIKDDHQTAGPEPGRNAAGCAYPGGKFLLEYLNRIMHETHYTGPTEARGVRRAAALQLLVARAGTSHGILSSRLKLLANVCGGV